MNYQEIYNRIVKRRLENPLETYTEKHHIIPKSLGGDNKKTNLVKLSAREHYICHLLLTKIYNTGVAHDKMIYAFMMMCNAKSGFQRRDFKNNSRLYERRRIEHSQIMSRRMFLENKKYMWVYNPELKISKRVPKETKIESGWIKGRIFNWEKFESKNKTERECKYCKNKFLTERSNFCSQQCRQRYHFENSFLYRNKELFKEYYIKTKSLRKTFMLMGKSNLGGNLYVFLKLLEYEPELKEIYNERKKENADITQW